MPEQDHHVSAEEMASVDFEPYCADLIERMAKELEEPAWRERQSSLKIKMLAAFGLLAHSKVELIDMAAKKEVAESLLAFRDSFADTAEWYQAGADLLNAIKTRIDIALAANEARGQSDNT